MGPGPAAQPRRKRLTPTPAVLPLFSACLVVPKIFASLISPGVMQLWQINATPVPAIPRMNPIRAVHASWHSPPLPGPPAAPTAAFSLCSAFARWSTSGRFPSGPLRRTSRWFLTRAPPTSGCRPSTAPAKPAVSRGSPKQPVVVGPQVSPPGWPRHPASTKGTGTTTGATSLPSLKPPAGLSPPQAFLDKRGAAFVFGLELQPEGRGSRDRSSVGLFARQRRRRSHHQDPVPSARGRYRPCSLGLSCGRAFKQTRRDYST